MWGFLTAILAYFNPLPAVRSFKTYPYTFTMPENPADIELRAYQLAQDKVRAAEGYRRDVYYDTQGFLTVGIGHKVTAADRLKLGQIITDAKIRSFWQKDIALAFDAAKSQARELGKFTPEMIAALTSVNFQLGTGWRSKFARTWAALKAGNASDAIARLNSSAWKQQTPARVSAFISSIRQTYNV